MIKEKAFLQDGNLAVFRGSGVTAPVRILFAGDMHIPLADSRDDEFQDNYRRMHQFQGGQCAAFEKLIETANNGNFDLLLLAGDLINFPTLANIEFVMKNLDKCKIPWLFTAGNHDWHFEALAGSEAKLRNEWTQKRLLPLYQDKNPLMSSLEINGLRIIAIDNSTYEILPEQLEFFREQTADGTTCVLTMHVPLYVPGRSIFFGCGNPNWNATNDPYWEIEQRQRWPENGHSECTMKFHEEVFATENLIGILAGHTHKFTTDLFRGKVQLVPDAASKGTFFELNFN